MICCVTSTLSLVLTGADRPAAMQGCAAADAVCYVQGGRPKHSGAAVWPCIVLCPLHGCSGGG